MKMSRIKWTMMIIIAAVCMAYLIPGILIRAEDYQNINIVKKGILSSDEIVPSHAFYLSMSEKVMVLNQMLKGKGKEMKQTTLDLEQNYVESLTWKALSSLYDYKWVPDLTSFYDTKMETKLYYCKIRPGSSSVVGHVYEMIITNPKYGSKITVYADARDGMILYLKAEGAADWLNSAERFHNDIFNGTNFSSADSVMPLTLQEEMISALNRLTLCECTYVSHQSEESENGFQCSVTTVVKTKVKGLDDEIVFQMQRTDGFIEFYFRNK